MRDSLDPEQRNIIYSLAIISNYGPFTFVVSVSLEGYCGWISRDKGNQRLLTTVLWTESPIGGCLDGRFICSPCWGDVYGVRGSEVFLVQILQYT